MVVVALLGGLPMVAVGAAPVTSAVALTTVRAMYVEPTGGRVFVSGDDSVLVYAAQGTLLTTISPVPGAAGMAADSAGNLWVSESTNGALARIDLATLTLAAEYPQGMAVGPSIAIAGPALWYPSSSALARFDLTAHTTTTRGAAATGYTQLVAVPRSSTLLVAFDIGSDSARRLNLAVDPVAAGPSFTIGTNLRQLAMTPDATKFVAASSGRSNFPEYTLATMVANSVVHPGAFYPSAVATSPAFGGIVVGGTQSANRIYVSPVGSTTSVLTIDLPGNLLDRMVGVSPDAARAYAIVDIAGARTLVTYGLAPTISVALPSQVVADVPTTVTVSGSGLGAVSAATLGGVPSTFVVDSSSQVRVNTPIGVAPGSHPLVLTTPLGVATTTLTVVPNGGATLTGIVRSANGPVAGVGVTLSGAGIGGQRSTTSAFDGRYTFGGLPYGSDYRLTFHRPAGPDQLITGLTATPNTTTAFDVDLRTPVPSGAELGRVPLPSNTASRMVVDPTTQNVFVTLGSEVDVFDRDGNLIVRMQNQAGAQGLAVDGSMLYVNQRTTQTITAIDIPSLTVIGSFPTNVPTNGELVVAGGKLIYTNGDNQWMNLQARDLATGSISTTSASFYNPQLASVDGSTALFAAWTIGVSPGSAFLFNAVTMTQIGGATSYGLLLADATTGKAWTSDGSERTMPTLVANGVQYLVAGSYNYTGAYSPAHGGVLQFGRMISVVGTPITATELPDVPVTADLAQSGDRAYYTTASGQFVVYDLQPRITQTSPQTVVAGVPATIDVTGSGLGRVTGATVDGVPAPVALTSPTSVRVTLPTSVLAGDRPLVLTTPFGVASSAITVGENTGATLTGTVSSGSTPQTGVIMTLSGGGLAIPRTETTASDGRYTFTGVPFGADYLVRAHPAVGPDQVVKGVRLTPNNTTTMNFNFQSTPAGPGGVGLPPGTVRKTVVDPITGRVFVSVGDEVVAFDRDGNLLVRFQDQWSAQGLAIDGSTLYVNLRTAGSITTIDIPTLVVMGSISTDTVTDGELVIAGGRLVYTSGTGSYSVRIIGRDLATGSVVVFGGLWSAPNLRSVSGNSNLFLVWEANVSTPSIYVVDAVTLGSRNIWNAPTPPVATTSTAQLWSGDGRQFSLATLTADGSQYVGTGGPTAYSPGHGGVLAFGRSVFLVGNTNTAATLNSAPTTVAFDDAGDRVYYTTGGGLFVMQDLVPRITAVSPDPLYGDVGSFNVAGSGLGATSAVAVDGAPVPFTVGGPTQVSLSVPVLAAGAHTIRVTTPWGTSSDFGFTAVDRPPRPTVTAVAPASVPTNGGPITITGTGLSSVTALTIAGVPIPSFTVVNDTTITATVPAHVALTGAVVVASPGGSNIAQPNFSWYAPRPVVTSVSPAQGTIAGGATVTVRGTGFRFASAVAFGTTAAAFAVIDDTTIQASAPAHGIGPVDVVVTTAGGSSPTGAPDVFTYIPLPPTVTSISPGSGIVTGGYQAVIRGTNLATTTAVSFGGVGAISMVVIDDTTIVVVVPPHAAGQVGVTVTTPSGASTASAATQFVYTPAPEGSVTGSVRSSAGALAGMMVILSPTSAFSVAASASSGADGTFRVDHVAPGQYKVVTLDPGTIFGAPDHYVPQFYENGGSTLAAFATATTITVTANGVTDLHPVTLVHNHPGSITAHVQDAAGNPLVGMFVAVVQSSSLQIVTLARTDGAGNVTIGGLDPGTYKVATFDPVAIFGGTGYTAQWYKNGGSTGAGFGAATPVAVLPGADTVLDPVVLVHP